MRKESIWSGILALWLLALASCTGTNPGTTVKKPSAPLTSEGDSSFSEGKNSSGEASLSPLPPSVDVTDFPSLSGSLPASEDTVSPTAAPTPTPTPTSDPTPKVPPSEEELRAQVSSLKHYEESYLPDRTVEDVGIHVEMILKCMILKCMIPNEVQQKCNTGEGKQKNFCSVYLLHFYL